MDPVEYWEPLQLTPEFETQLSPIRLALGASTVDDCNAFSGGDRKVANIAGITGDDAIASVSDEDKRRIDRVVRSGPSQQDSRLAAQSFVDGADLHGAEQAGEGGLASAFVTPDLGQNHGIRSKPDILLLRDAKSSDHCAVVPVNPKQRARVEDQDAQPAGLREPGCRSLSARCSSSGVS